LSYFEHHLSRKVVADNSELTENQTIELVLRDIGLEYISKPAIRVQNYYIRGGAYI
jgi:hypothetical protein